MAKKGWEEQGESRLSSLNEWDCNRGDPLQQEKERTDRGQEQKQHRAQESCRRRAGEGGKGEAREVRIRRQMDFGVDEGWRVEPMLAMADGCVVRCARGASSRGSWSRGLTVETGGGGGGRWWSGPGSAVVVASLPPLSRCREQRGSEAHAGRVRPCCSTPFPLSSPAVSGCRSVGHAQGRRGAGWPLGSDTLGRGRAIRDRGRPAAAVFATSSSRKRGPVVEVEVEVPVRSGRSRRCADLERGEDGWTHALREGGVRTLHSQPPTVAMIGPDEVHRGAHGGVGRLPCGPRR